MKTSPQQIIMNMINDSANPMMKNLIQMAKNGDKEGVEKFARNFCNEHGRNFDEEFSKFMRNFNGINFK